jgi:ribose transport system ATP-binding protein
MGVAVPAQHRAYSGAASRIAASNASGFKRRGTMTDVVLEIDNLTKEFPGVRAVDDVSFNIVRNTVHCLVGENGAGKSTLIKILTGAVARTSGSVVMNGKKYVAHDPRDAKQKGISTLFQELNVVDQLSIEENLTLGMEDTRFGFLRKTDKIKKMIDVLQSIEPSISPGQQVSSLSVAQKQMVEIARAVASESEVIIMDEPTAAISEEEIQRLFKIIRNLKHKNVTVIYISHRLDEVFELGEYVTVLRDGKHIETKPIREVKNRAELIKMMIGKAVYEQYIPRDLSNAENLLEVRGLRNKKLKGISFEVKRGEIVGFYGLVGAGKTELARAIYGADKYTGDIRFKGKQLELLTAKVIKSGIAMVPEERRSQGLFTLLTIMSNIPVMNMGKISKAGFINAATERSITLEYIEKLGIMTSSTEKEVAKLSGGNQQKVVFSKCLFADADLLILDEPTRGVDVGAKSEIYRIIRELSNSGKSIILCSSELSEIMNMCDRIFLLYDGSLRQTLDNCSDLDSQEVLHVCTGGEYAE